MSVITVLLLNITALFLTRKNKKDSAVNLLTLLMGCLCAVYLAALTDLLFWGTLLTFCIMTGYCIYTIIKIGVKNALQALRQGVDTALLLFDLAYAVFALLYVLKKPLVYYWDELKIWAPTAKYVFCYDKLYSIGINALACDRNYPAGNALLTYFTQFFAGQFHDYYILLAYTILLCAVAAAAAALVQKLAGKKPLTVGCFFVLLLMPFTFIYHSACNNLSQISYAYATTMVDYNVATAFLAVIVLYLYSEQQLYYLLPLAFLITVKKNGIFFALLALCIIACFALLRPTQTRKKPLILLRDLICWFAVLAVSYGGWQLHLKLFEVPVDQNSYALNYSHEELMTTDEEQTLRDPRFTAVTDATPSAILVPSMRTERYRQILSELQQYYLHNHETIFCRDIFLIAGLFLLGCFTAVCAQKGHRAAILLVTCGLTAGCFIYGLVIGYQMQFYTDLMVEYPRYMSSYYAGWLMLQAVLFLAFIPKKTALKNTLLCIFILFSFKRSVLLTPRLTVFDRAENTYAVQQQDRTEFAGIKPALSPGDRVCLVYPYANAELWFTFRYEMLPYLCGFDTQNTGIDFSVGFCEANRFREEHSSVYFADKDTYRQLMAEYFDYIYVYKADDEYIASYSELFSDGICEGTLYQVTEDEIPMRRIP